MSDPFGALDDLPPFERLAELAVLLEARDRDVERWERARPDAGA